MLKLVNLVMVGMLSFSSIGWANNMQVAEAAKSQIGRTLYYDSGYAKLAYPMGDISEVSGVCSDVVIRALRANNVDLQVLVHEDMVRHFNQYPKTWGLKQTDRNIDHRRVPNLEVFLKRQGKALSVTKNDQDYRPGDIVSWRLDNGLPHIGIVAKNKAPDSQRPLIIHNIGAGTQEEDVLYAWRIVGHYRYFKP